MEFSLRLFDQIESTLRSDAASGRQQRSSPRVGVRFRQRIIPNVVGDSGTKPIEVWIRDLSVTGLGFSMSKPLPVGSQFLVPLVMPNRVNISIRYTVAHCTPVSAGVYVAGATIDRVIGDECKELTDLVERLAKLKAVAEAPEGARKPMRR